MKTGRRKMSSLRVPYSLHSIKLGRKYFLFTNLRCQLNGTLTRWSLQIRGTASRFVSL